MVANTEDVPLKKRHSNTKIAKALGIHPCNLKKHRVDIHGNNFQWSFGGCKQRNDCLPPKVVKCVVNYWKHNTWISPNKKDICQKRIGVREYEKHPLHLLEVTEVSFPHDYASWKNGFIYLLFVYQCMFVFMVPRVLLVLVLHSTPTTIVLLHCPIFECHSHQVSTMP